MSSQAVLLERALESPRLVLVFDYDGTLAEFAPTPAYLQPNAEVVHLLEGLVASPRVSASILSGRRLEAVQALVPIEGMALAGSYGIEVELPDGERIERLRMSEVRPFLDELLPRWKELVEEREGFFLEDKGWTIAIHARFAAAEESVKILAEASQSAAEIGLPPDFRLMADERFLEVAPTVANKHDGVKYLLQRMRVSGAPVYFGDDDKDLEAFEAVREVGGLTVIVGSRHLRERPDADCTFDAPASLRRWLRLLISRL